MGSNWEILSKVLSKKEWLTTKEISQKADIPFASAGRALKTAEKYQLVKSRKVDPIKRNGNKILVWKAI